MLVIFNSDYIYHCVRYEFFLPLRCSYLLNYKTWSKLQDQNQGRPRATVTHCGRMG